MNNFYTSQELSQMGFKCVGENVMLSKKAAFYGCEQMVFGDNVRVDDFCVLSGVIRFGNNIHIANFCFVAGGEEGIVFKDFSGLAYRCTVFTRSDDYSGETMTNPTIPEGYRYNTFKKSVTVGEHCIVGANSVIMPGADIADGCSVGAFSLVTKPTEPWGVYFGIPARRMKERKNGLLEQARDYKEKRR